MGLVRRTPRSRGDYGDIWSYVAERNPDAAADLLRRFDDTLRMLSEHPRGGPARPEFRPRLRSFPVGEYVIYYRPIRGGIEVARVLHGARDAREVFKQRRRRKK